MEEIERLDVVLRQVLSKAQDEYATMASWDLLRTNDEEIKIYFVRYSLLKRLINSLESFLDENQRLQQLELQLRKAP